jgi:hypothetical protein
VELQLKSSIRARKSTKNDNCLSSGLTTHSNNNFIRAMRDIRSTSLDLVHQFKIEIALIVAIWTFSTSEIIVAFPV